MFLPSQYTDSEKVKKEKNLKFTMELNLLQDRKRKEKEEQDR